MDRKRRGDLFYLTRAQFDPIRQAEDEPDTPRPEETEPFIKERHTFEEDQLLQVLRERFLTWRNTSGT
eukprot:12901139-Prorocentrum_lima.AAC.1